MEYVKNDRKQVFGSEELDAGYMKKIQRLFEERVRALTTEEITRPLTEWVR
ncbi:MAG TPA: hypothetical protein VJH88_02915 [Candidatus Nanoarchaeia archaeon]|nr:hypothetical protein [Candidatus Nanoarchaeia archaeon]